jgi:2-polyprenyl-3-methyl-5-hydroxy-6-metoxy-1,4-benzoquinol methylase
MTCVACGLLASGWSFAQEAQVPPGRETYLGRVIAQTMSFHGAGWLIRPEREDEEGTLSEIVGQLGIQSGWQICDMGCGNGYYTLPLAEATGEQGRVVAVDIQPEMLRMLRTRVNRGQVKNIEPILGLPHDPKLPPEAFDLLLMVDVYHEFSHPEEMLRAIRASLKPSGLVALLEYREEDPEVPILPLHKMSKQQIVKEYSANGLRVVREYDGLPWQHLMFLGIDPDWTPSPTEPKN